MLDSQGRRVEVASLLGTWPLYFRDWRAARAVARLSSRRTKSSEAREIINEKQFSFPLSRCCYYFLHSHMDKHRAASSFPAGRLTGAMQDFQALFQTARLRQIRGHLPLAGRNALPLLAKP